VFSYDFVIDSIPMIVNIADQVFEDFEKAHWEKNPEDREKGKFKLEMSNMMKNFASSVIIS